MTESGQIYAYNIEITPLRIGDEPSSHPMSSEEIDAALGHLSLKIDVLNRVIRRYFTLRTALAQHYITQEEFNEELSLLMLEVEGEP